MSHISGANNDAAAAAVVAGAQVNKLREKLNAILTVLNAEEPMDAHEWHSREAKRSQIVTLIARLDAAVLTVDATSKSPSMDHLISPCLTSAMDENTPIRAAETAARHEMLSYREESHATKESPALCSAAFTPPRRLLGNVFLRHDLQTPMKAPAREARHESRPPSRLLPDEHRRDTHADAGVKSEKRDPACAARWALHRVRPRIGDTDTPTLSSSASSSDALYEPQYSGEHRATRCVVPYTPRHVTASPSRAVPRRSVRLYDYQCIPASFWINVWPCFGNATSRARQPTPVLVRGCYRFFADVMEKAAEQTRCQPASTALYTPDGYPIKELEDLTAGHHYLLFPAGAFYRKQAVPTALLWVLYTDAQRLVHGA